ncbi:MAG: hypothetical protein NC081_06065 [Roseburia sp.]|nr:hypothetical protein [Roseburia sp.]
MKFYILASLFLFGMVIFRAIRKGDRKQKALEDAFWAREAAANSVRRKPIDDLPYIYIPLELLPVEALPDNPEVADCVRLIRQLSEKRILNLTGYTNTDLKLEYGTANITALSEYDQNYTLLARTLQKWAEELLKYGCTEEARTVMEFAVSTSTDVSNTYYRLAEYWNARNDTCQIQKLIEAAQGLRSSNRDIIVRTLQETYL